MKNKLILDVGCGENKECNSIGIDIIKTNSTDIIVNVDKTFFPFKDNSFKKIIFNSSLEHFDNIIKIMEETWRISKNDATIIINVPHFTSADSFTDITHRHFFSTSSFNYFLDNGMYNYYSKVRFKLISTEIKFWELHEKIRIAPYKVLGISWFANKFNRIYERFFGFIFPARSLHFILKVIK